MRQSQYVVRCCCPEMICQEIGINSISITSLITMDAKCQAASTVLQTNGSMIMNQNDNIRGSSTLVVVIGLNATVIKDKSSYILLLTISSPRTMVIRVWILRNGTMMNYCIQSLQTFLDILVNHLSYYKYHPPVFEFCRLLIFRYNGCI